MNICLIGDGLTSLALAKNLVNKQINVCVYAKNIKKQKFQSRTLGISKNNFDFFNREILKLKKKLFWDIKQIEVYSEKYKNEKILNFENSKKQLFSMLKNDEIYNFLEDDLKKNRLYKKVLIKKNFFYKKILKSQKYSLIINCDSKNEISKKFFYKKITKSYASNAYTTIMRHKSIANKKAVQIFTKIGPIAFLPISNSQTSVVYSIMNKDSSLDEKEIKELIIKYNKNYKIKSFSKIEKFNLNFSATRNYYKNTIMAFGDVIHKIHPLAGQGFNMTLRDIKNFSRIIQNRIDLGLPIDHSIYEEFEKSAKHFNLIFALGIDFIYEFFNFDNKYSRSYSNLLLKLVNKNKFLNKFLTKYADQGLVL